jgi:hypothetical protein
LRRRVFSGALGTPERNIVQNILMNDHTEYQSIHVAHHSARNMKNSRDDRQHKAAATTAGLRYNDITDDAAQGGTARRRAPRKGTFRGEGALFSVRSEVDADVETEAEAN